MNKGAGKVRENLIFQNAMTLKLIYVGEKKDHIYHLLLKIYRLTKFHLNPRSACQLLC
jgi:hypothetical protein